MQASIRCDYCGNLDAYKTDIRKILLTPLFNADVCMDAFVNKQIWATENRGIENLKMAIPVSHKKENFTQSCYRVCHVNFQMTYRGNYPMTIDCCRSWHYLSILFEFQVFQNDLVCKITLGHTKIFATSHWSIALSLQFLP